jgi:hypothetical protein
LCYGEDASAVAGCDGHGRAGLRFGERTLREQPGIVN